MGTFLDFRNFTKGHSFVCGTDVAFCDITLDLMARLCLDCGKSFETEEKMIKHIRGKHNSRNEKGASVRCPYCKCFKKDKERHCIIVHAKRLDIPGDYPTEEEFEMQADELGGTEQTEDQEDQEEGGGGPPVGA